MPYKTVKNKDGSVKVVNAATGKVHAAHTTMQKAQAQMRAMQAAEHKNGTPTRAHVDKTAGSKKKSASKARGARR